MSHDAETTARRSLLNGLGVAALAGVALASAPAEAAKKKAGKSFEPARHAEDAWMDALLGTHRVFIDTDSTSGAGNGLRYATNILNAQASGYKGTDQDMAIIVCLRHASTPLGFNDAMWAKYGSSLGSMMGAGGPRGAGGGPAPAGAAPGGAPPPATAAAGAPAAAPAGAPAIAAAATKNAQARNIADAAKRGVHFAICGMATSLMSGMIARQAGSTADAVLAELTANMVPNGHIVPAGVMALTRAQEYGYSFLYASA
jgi:intracellular sulfur oxidation DsrE/DsrF family protein